MSADLPFVVGSEDEIRLTLYDRIAGVDTAIDLTGATVVLKGRIDDGSVKSWTCDPDPDQSTYRGRCTYELATGDIDEAGTLWLQAEVTVGGRTFRSRSILRRVDAAIGS